MNASIWDGKDRRTGERRMWLRRPDVYDGQAHSGTYRGRRLRSRRKKERRRDPRAVQLEQTVTVLREMAGPQRGHASAGIWISGGSIVLNKEAGEAVVRYVRRENPSPAGPEGGS